MEKFKEFVASGTINCQLSKLSSNRTELLGTRVEGERGRVLERAVELEVPPPRPAANHLRETTCYPFSISHGGFALDCPYLYLYM